MYMPWFAGALLLPGKPCECQTPTCVSPNPTHAPGSHSCGALLCALILAACCFCLLPVNTRECLFQSTDCLNFSAVYTVLVCAAPMHGCRMHFRHVPAHPTNRAARASTHSHTTHTHHKRVPRCIAAYTPVCVVKESKRGNVCRCLL